MKEDRLSQIVQFCKLIDKEKFVQRRTYLSDGERLENDAEHAWHMAVMALLLSEYANEKVDVLKVVSLLLVHDLVEIYAGDTFAYDEEGKKTQREREAAAAERLYSQLPEDLAGRMLTFLPLEQIDEMDHWQGSELNRAKEILAYELTKMVHGEEEAEKAAAAAKEIFGGTGSHENMPTTELTADDLPEGRITLAELLVKAGLVPSKGEARRLIQQGGVAVNDVKAENFAQDYTAEQLKEGLIVKKGKKVFHRIIMA